MGVTWGGAAQPVTRPDDMGCLIPPAQRARRSLCPCGGANTIRVVVEYIAVRGARIDYAGGRFCYHSNALIDIEIPADATPVRALIYDLHQPDEIITITFTQAEHKRRMSPAGRDVPGEAGDDQQGRYLA
jgi:hypothetical protein